MSFDALQWACRQDASDPIAKLVLLGLARHANSSGLSWPSLAQLAEFSGLDRKGVMRRQHWLERAGLIEDTGKRRGDTGRVKVWALALGQKALALDMPKRSRRGDHLNGAQWSRTKGRLDAPNGPCQGTIPGAPPLTSDISQIAAANAGNGDSRGMIPLEAHNSPAPGTRNKSEKNKEAKPAKDMDRVMAAWNDMAKANGLPIAQVLTEDRRKSLRARLKEHGLAPILGAIAAVPKSPFLLGHNDRDWKASIDFLLRPARLNRLIEGGYTDQVGPGSGGKARPDDPKPYYQIINERGGQ